MSDGGEGSRDEAERLSRGCVHCGGCGQTMVFHPAYRGVRVEDRECEVRGEIVMRPTAMVVAAHCICPAGRWMRAKTDRDLLPRIPDMMLILAGQSRWLALDPTGDRPCNSPSPGLDRMKATVGRHVGTMGGR